VSLVKRVRARLSVTVVSLFVLLAAHLSWSQDAPTNMQPTLRLEKPKYLIDEAIRFWVGVEVKGPRAIPRELQKPCALSITKPSGTVQVQAVDWPTDGDGSHGWEGGAGLGDDEIEVGNYTLAFECSGIRTRLLQLTVEKSDVTTKVSAGFHFERSGAIIMGSSVPVVLIVRNNSPYPIQFPQRGIGGEGVSIFVTRREPRFDSAFFYPWEKLSHSSASFDSYTWDAAATVPSVVLKGGEQFEQRFALEEAYRFDQPGNYEVEFSTVLSLLIGEKNGAFAEVCPVRLPVVARQNFTVSPAQ